MIKSVLQTTIADVFSINSDKIYKIPKYQREYTWGIKDWDALFNDVTENDAAGNSTQSTFTSKWSGDQTEDEPVFDVIDGEGASVGSYGALKDAFEACQSGYTVLVGEDSELTEVIPDGVTVEVLSGYTLTVSDMANVGNGTVKFRIGSDFVYKGSKIIGDFNDNEAALQNNDCIFTLTKDSLTMSEGNKAWIRGEDTKNGSGQAGTVYSCKTAIQGQSPASFSD